MTADADTRIPVDPAFFELAQNVVAGAFVVLLMLAVGLDLSLSGVAATLRRPSGLLAGALAGYVLVPLVAAGLAWALHLGPGARAGLLLCAVAPGGPMGAYLALAARGEVALAAALVLTFNVANTLLIPLELSAFGIEVDAHGSGYFWDMARMIVLYQLLPLGVGMVGQRLWPGKARRAQVVISTVANVLLLVFSAAVIFVEGHRFMEAGVPTLLAVQGAVLASLVLGWLVSPPRREARVTLACIGVIHSSSACVLLASAWFDDPATLLTVLTWAGLMSVTGLLASMWMARGARAAGHAAASMDRSEPR